MRTLGLNEGAMCKRRLYNGQKKREKPRGQKTKSDGRRPFLTDLNAAADRGYQSKPVRTDKVSEGAGLALGPIPSQKKAIRRPYYRTIKRPINRSGGASEPEPFDGNDPARLSVIPGEERVFHRKCHMWHGGGLVLHKWWKERSESACRPLPNMVLEWTGGSCKLISGHFSADLSAQATPLKTFTIFGRTPFPRVTTLR
ncbi:hypothetical protein AAG570_009217 [Ranatra chinensis]|uniref:Uncharacterized protein n=1 Tax=Ranatra chinensis TaxID=642074 RepID=A0ABD0YT75_9HEMI